MEAASLLSLAARVAGEHELQKALDAIVRGLAEQPAIALARVWLLLPGDLCPSCFMREECRDQTHCLHLVASAGNPHNSPGEDWTFRNGHFRRVPLGARKTGMVGATGTPLLIEDLAPESEWIARPEWAKREQIRSFVGHPLVFGTRTLGVLAVFSREPLDDQSFKWLRVFADHAAIVISNAQTFETLTRAQEALREREALIHAFWDNSSNLIFVKDREGRYVVANKKFEKTFCLAQRQIMGKKDDELFSPEQAAAFRANDQQVLRAGAPMEFEEVSLQDDGAHTSIVQRFPLFDKEGEIYAIGGIVTDITERKAAEEARRQSEERHRIVVETATDAVIGIDENSRILFVNPATSRIFGYEARELVGQALTMLMPESFRHSHCAGLKRYLGTGRRSFNWSSTELLGLRKSGEEFPIEVSFGEVIKDGSRIFTGFIRDISERRQAEERLRQSERHLRLVTETIPEMLWSANPDGGLDFFNRHGLEYTGVSEADAMGSGWMKSVHPDDIDKTAKAWFHCVSHGLAYQAEFRCFHAPDQTYRWCLSSALPLRDAEGHIVKWYGSVVDLHDWKMAQETLREAEVRFRQELKHERDRLRFLLNLNNKIVSNLDLNQLFRAVVSELRSVMECTFVGLALPDADDKHLRQSALDYAQARGVIKEGMLLPIQGSCSGRAFRTRKPFILQSAAEAERDPQIYASSEGRPFFKLVTEEGFKSGCFLPLITRNRVLGILQVTRQEEFAFDQEDIDFLSQVASQIALAVDNALNYEQVNESRARLAAENLYLVEEIRKEHNFEEIVGNSPPILDLLRKVELAGPSDASVLICGETGTGKELIARAIHARSSRRDQALVKVNCGSIPAGLVESELFGHVKGAFTGATSSRTGRFEIANRGTLFLDEVGELPLDTQVKLLRVLQEQEFEPVGSCRTVRVNVRIIAATNRDLEEAVKAGQFRSDLYYRLNVLPLWVPPLRERRSDISQLVMLFLDRFSRKSGRKMEGVAQETMQRLMDYSWPGNIRELQNVIERGVVLSKGPIMILGPDFLPVELEHHTAPQASTTGDGNSGGDVLSLEDMEKRHILAVLERTQGVINGSKGAAELLKLHPSTLRSRMKKLGITRQGDDLS